jgi:NTE family protein
MKRQVAFVLGGGGARGALQVGALRALLENEFYPDLLVGTSIGAVNAVFLGLYGFSLNSIDRLEQAWYDAREADILPSSFLWLTVRALFKRPSPYSSYRMQNFFIEHGLKPDLRFREIQDIRLITVATDLNSGSRILYGIDPEQSVLEGVLASTALPPWVSPLEKDGQLLMDGGTVCNLPIEPALNAGATEIIALDLSDPRDNPSEANGFNAFLSKLLNAVEQRQIELEKSLAAARHVPVRHIRLFWNEPTPIWNFQHCDELFACGYKITRRQIEDWNASRRAPWQSWLLKIKQKDNLRIPAKSLTSP